MEVLGEPLINLRIVKPLSRLGVHLRGTRLEQEHVPAVLERRDVLVERLPVLEMMTTRDLVVNSRGMR